MLTISKLKRWSINYYIDTAQAAEDAAKDLARAGGGLGEYYSERETRTPVWLLAGDTHTTATLVGLTDAQRAGGGADAAVVARWLDEGVTPNGSHGRAFGERGVHGFDLTFCAPKSVSLVRALRTDDVVAKAIADAHTTALSEAMEYLAAHAGYTRVHNARTGEKDLVRLPGLVAIAYQHETSRCGDPHLHTHVIVPNRQARADGQLVSIDGTSLYHEARAAGVIYQATLRRELHQSMGFEWAPVDPSTGMAELAGVDRDTITAWSRRSTQLRESAAHNLTVVDGPLSAAQLATAQKATRPAKPEELRNTNHPAAEQIPVRNGNRWRVTAINSYNGRLAARRLDDNTAAFNNDYVREHITYGYAVTVHSAQGATADTTHAVLSEAAARALFYVAISRGRDANTAYLYERPVEREYDRQHIDGVQSAERGTGRHASRLARAIIANDGGRPVTAHGVAAQAEGVGLPDRVRALLSRRAAAVHRRRAIYTEWQAESRAFVDAMVQARARHASRTREHGLDHGIDI
jgi:conjugative relaxase-like TrwC/TraI family protein